MKIQAEGAKIPHNRVEREQSIERIPSICPLLREII
jgi:hypothetical protein